MRSYSKLKIFSIIGFTTIAVASFSDATAISSDVNFSVSNNSTVIEINIPNSVTLNLSPTSGRAFDTADMNIGIGTNNVSGYRLFVTPSSAALTRTSSIIDGESNVSTPTIQPILNYYASGGITNERFASNNSALDPYTLNRWGYKLSTETPYSPMSEDSTLIAYSTSPSNATGQDIIMNFAAKVDTSQPAGVYTTTLNFVAVANITGTCNPTGTTISTIFCMQDINESNIESIKDSMALYRSYILMDSRDNKSYYVSKMAARNKTDIWMTQNLDHDIGDIAGGTYTSDDTDLPADATWTPTVSEHTHTTSDKTWDDSSIIPQSYDPGDLCWNGIIRNDWSGTFDNSTIACDDDANIQYSIGNYYNWTAALAMSDSSDYGGYINIDQSICPAGWMLPNSSSFSLYFIREGFYGGINGNIQNYPAFFVYSGLYHVAQDNNIGGIWGIGGLGFYWSSTSVSSTKSNMLDFYKGDSEVTIWSYDRSIGLPVRCMTRQ